MVTTRRQSHGLPNEELRDGSEIDTPRNISKKRKNETSKASTSLMLPAKRRKNNDGQNPSGKSVPTPSEQQRPTVQVDKADNNGHDEHEGQKREGESQELDARQSRSKQALGEAGKGDDNNTSGTKLREQLASSQDNKAAPNRSKDDQDDQGGFEASDSAVSPDSKTTGTAAISTAPKGIHFRFGSEEPYVNAMSLNDEQLHANALSTSVVERSEESDAEDEAPEIITASVGAEAASSLNMQADKAAERQRAAVKAKRRERNDLLRQQAQSSKKAKTRKAGVTPHDKSELDNFANSSTSYVEPAPSRTRTVARRPLPALLPDDILAADPIARPVTPPLDQKQGEKLKPKKHIFVETAPKPPKDIKRGPVKIRVLEGGRQNLPPKASKESRNIKESWLGGRRGRNGAAAMERRKVGLGFLRK